MGTAISSQEDSAREIPLSPPLWLWLACGVFWTLFTLVWVQSNLTVLAEAGRPSTLPAQLHRIASATGLWALTTPLMVTWSARRPLRRPLDWPRLLTFLGVGLAFVMIGTPLVALLREGLAARLSPPWEVLWSPGLLTDLLQYGFFVTAGQLWAVQRRLSEHQRELRAQESRELAIRAQLTDARLRALRMHVQPHFVFNALNTVTTLQRKGETRAAIAMLIRLADLMRAAMADDAPHTVTLAEEMELLDVYLALERERFGDRLVLEVDIAAEAGAVSVPHLILQPLVENAIRHGLARVEGPARIRVCAHLAGEMLRLTVENDTVDLSKDWRPERDSGRGLALTRQRLDALYGTRHELAITGVDRIVTVTFLVPLT